MAAWSRHTAGEEQREADPPLERTVVGFRGYNVGLDHAVIVGGSFAGIVTAGVLAGRFDHVTIVERDDLPDGPTVRKGVPQGPHVHGILKLGRDILDDVFPGFVADTEKEGAFLFPWGPPGAETAAMGYAVRRPLLESVARRRALALPNVELVHGAAEGLVASAGKRVEGVTVADRDGTRRDVTGDLVVDASGRGSAAPAWLEKAGLEAPAETVVNAFGGYASRYLHVPEEAWPGDMRYMAALPQAANTKGAILYPQDSGYYVISLFGQSRDYPPNDEEGFDAFLQASVNPMIHPIVAQSEAVTEIRTSRSTANRWRHYEQRTDPPAGFVVLGDAACTFNPMNGQGISTACLGAVTLGETLTDLDGDLVALPREFQSRLAERMQFPWKMAMDFDFQFPATVGERPVPTPEDIAAAEHKAVLGQIAMTGDTKVMEAMLMTIQTFDTSWLYTPEIMAKVDAFLAERDAATDAGALSADRPA